MLMQIITLHPDSKVLRSAFCSYCVSTLRINGIKCFVHLLP
jgi:hypothetical protein